MNAPVTWLERGERLTIGALKGLGFSSRYVSSSMGKIHLLEKAGKGSLPPMLLVHGVGSSLSAFARLLLQLQRHTTRLIAIDLPGHGLSDVPPTANARASMDAVLEALDGALPEPVIVVGNSMGGGVALRIAIERPAWVRGVVVTSPGGAGMDVEALRAFLERFALEDAAAGADFFSRLVYRSPWYLQIAGRIAKQSFDRPYLREFLAQLDEAILFTPEELSRLRAPMFFIWGKADRLMLPEMREWFRAHLPAHALVEEPEHYAHCPHLDQPAELASRIVAFTQEIVKETTT